MTTFADPILRSISTETNEAAFDRLSARFGALREEELMPINVDIIGAVHTVLGCLPKIRAVQIPEGTTLPDGFDAEHFDALEELALALGWAHYRYRSADLQVEPIEEMVSQMTAMRQQLVADATALVTRKVIDGHVLDQLKGGPGYRNILEDAMTLVAQLGAHEAEVIAQSGIKAGDLDRIKVAGRELAAALGRREEMPKQSSDAADTRVRAFTMFWRAYDEVRRAVTYLRWHADDVDQIAPSLFAGRSHKSGDAAPTPPADVPPPATPPPATPPTPSGPMPGGSPFTS